MLNYHKTGVLLESMILFVVFLILIYFIRDKAKLTSDKFLMLIIIGGLIFYFVAGYLTHYFFGNNSGALIHTFSLVLAYIILIVPFFLIKAVQYSLKQK